MHILRDIKCEIKFKPWYQFGWIIKTTLDGKLA